MKSITSGLVLVAVAIGITTLGIFIFAPHTVQQYYVGSATSSRGYCVMASINWDQDEVVFCSDEIAKTIEAANRLNKMIKDNK